jgi:succinate dehydrogenase / fumarate reductase cytochrome b subunit
VILLGFTWAFFYHLCNGIRHLAWDAGWGFDLKTMTRSGYAVVAASAALTLLAWSLAYAWRP